MADYSNGKWQEDEELDEILWEIEAEKGEGSRSDDPAPDITQRGRLTEEQRQRNKRASVLREILDYIVTLAVVAGVVFLLNSSVLINARIPSESMEPTIEKGNQIFGSRITYRFHDPRRFDIIIFRYPDDESQFFIKRVIGLPGETVVIDSGAVYINGDPTPLDDSYVAEPWGMFEEPMVLEVPEGCYFVMGDNRNHSNDSRYWNNHFVAEDKILGKAVVRYWPVWEIKLFRYTPPSEE